MTPARYNAIDYQHGVLIVDGVVAHLLMTIVMAVAGSYAIALALDRTRLALLFGLSPDNNR